LSNSGGIDTKGERGSFQAFGIPEIFCRLPNVYIGLMYRWGFSNEKNVVYTKKDAKIIPKGIME